MNDKIKTYEVVVRGDGLMYAREAFYEDQGLTNAFSLGVCNSITEGKQLIKQHKVNIEKRRKANETTVLYSENVKNEKSN